MSALPDQKKKTLSIWNVIKLILAAGLTAFVLSKTNLPDFVNNLRNVSIPWLIGSSLLFVLVTLVKSFQYFILLRDKLSYPQVLNVIIWQNAISNYLLTGAGIATYVTMTRLDHEIRVNRSLAIFLLIKAGDLTVIWSALLASTILLWSDLGSLQIPLMLLMLALGLVVLAFILVVLLRQRFVGALRLFLEGMGLFRFRAVSQTLDHLQVMANVDRSSLRRVFYQLMLSSVVYLGATLAWSYSNLAVFHLFLQPVQFIFISSLIQLVSYIPISVFGGLGLTESSSLYFWNLFNVTPEVLAPAMIGIRLIFYIVNLIPLIYLPLYAISHGSQKTQGNERQKP